MKLEFLWDEEKTRKLFKTHLILFLIGGVIASIYAFILPSTIPYRPIVLTVPTSFTVSCLIYLWLLPRPNPGLRFLLFTLEAQLMASIFMAVTGGFLGIVQFAPYMFLLFALFELGTQATLILAGFSLLTFIGVLVWILIKHLDPNVLQNFFYFAGSYLLIVVIEHNIGKELSLQFEARRKLEQIDDLKNQFITLASHYLRTPITVFKYFLGNMEKIDLTEQQRNNLVNAKVVLFGLENLIEKFLLISSIEKGQTKVTLTNGSLDQFIVKVIQALQPEAEKSQVNLFYQPPPQPLPEVYFDAVKLKEVFMSIIDNAIKYNHPKGSAKVILKLAGKWIVIQVMDTGQGIGTAHLKNLFAPFNKGSLAEVLNFDKPGFGLSLYLAKLIIEAHGGKITAESAEGQGSTFTIYLPLKQDKPLMVAP